MSAGRRHAMALMGITKELERVGAWPPIDSSELFDKHGELATTVGFFRPRIVVDRLYEGAPPWVKEFLLIHEGWHVLARHNLKLLLLNLVTLGFAGVFQKPRFEAQADSVALRVMNRMAFVNAVQHVYRLPRGEILSRVYGRTYGATWIERCERAGLVFGAEWKKKALEQPAVPFGPVAAKKRDAARADDRYAQAEPKP